MIENNIEFYFISNFSPWNIDSLSVDTFCHFVTVKSISDSKTDYNRAHINICNIIHPQETSKQ